MSTQHAKGLSPRGYTYPRFWSGPRRRALCIGLCTATLAACPEGSGDNTSDASAPQSTGDDTPDASSGTPTTSTTSTTGPIDGSMSTTEADTGAAPTCGDGHKDGDEACDDGNDINGGPRDLCNNDCTIYVAPTCGAPVMYTSCDEDIDLLDYDDHNNALRAIGICNGDPATSIVASDFASDVDPIEQNYPWQVARGFGTHLSDDDMDPNTPDRLLYSAREGSAFLLLATGGYTKPNDQGIVIADYNSQEFSPDGSIDDPDDVNELPPPFQFKVGSNGGAGGAPFQQCDGINDCSDTLEYQWVVKGKSDPNDRRWFSFKTRVPEGTFGYTFDFVFCSSEWPTWVNTDYNDLLIAYQLDPTPDDPKADPPVDAYTGNVAFIPDPNDPDRGLPLTVTALDPYFFHFGGYTYDEPQLAGTGFEQHACSDWFQAKGGVRPGAEVTIGFYIADMGDTKLTTLALLDNFRWDCGGCIPSEIDDCGVQNIP